MTFSDKIFNLQKKNPNDVILIKNGIFFVAVGKDALFLNEKLKLKCTCFKNKICKVGFLVKSAEKYINIMKEQGISFKIYILNEYKDEELIVENKGFLKNNYVEGSVNCSECKNKKESDEDVIKRLKGKYNGVL